MLYKFNSEIGRHLATPFIEIHFKERSLQRGFWLFTSLSNSYDKSFSQKKKRCLVRFLIGLWDVFLPLLIQYKWTFFLCTTYINISLSYSPIHSCQFTFFSWHSCVSILSKVLLFHAFINNGNVLKNGGVECDEICKHYGMNKIKIIFF